ncbi:MAG: AAA family ATPase [Acholeplasmatales bacterium]|nr:AAA family ATPase [Acholeplasmatales bacterium]
MKRVSLEYLIEWNRKTIRKPLIINGQRQVGKTHLIKEIFIKEYYKKSITIDFFIDIDVILFTQTIDPKQILIFLENKFNITIDSETLIFFDDIQNCSEAINR